MSPTLLRSFDLLKSRLGINYIETESECDISLAIYAKQMQAKPRQTDRKQIGTPLLRRLKTATWSSKRSRRTRRSRWEINKLKAKVKRVTAAFLVVISKRSLCLSLRFRLALGTRLMIISMSSLAATTAPTGRKQHVKKPWSSLK